MSFLRFARMLVMATAAVLCMMLAAVVIALGSPQAAYAGSSSATQIVGDADEGDDGASATKLIGGTYEEPDKPVDKPAKTTPSKETAAEKKNLYKGSGTFYIAMAKSPKRVIGMKGNDRTNDARLVLASRKKTNLQRFELIKAGSGLYYIKNVATGRYLTAQRIANKQLKKKANVVMHTAVEKRTQKWQIVINDDKTVSFASYWAKSRLNVVGGKAKRGAKINLRAAADGAAQKFKLIRTKRNKDEIVKIGVPCYMQRPQLPTGCESVALTNALNYWGFGLSKTTIANSWMPYGTNGVYNFIGNPRTEDGWIICAPGIAKTANRYLKHKGSNVRAKVVHGETLKNLRPYLDQGCPVIVWTTIGMQNPNYTGVKRDGYTLNGNNHAVVLTGYNPKTGNYQVADSLAGTVWRSGYRFRMLYHAMDRQAVVLYD